MRTRAILAAAAVMFAVRCGRSSAADVIQPAHAGTQGETSHAAALGLDESRPAAARVRRLIRELDDDDYQVRQQAQRELSEIGAPALDAVREAANSSPSLEVRRRAEQSCGNCGTS